MQSLEDFSGVRGTIRPRTCRYGKVSVTLLWGRLLHTTRSLIIDYFPFYTFTPCYILFIFKDFIWIILNSFKCRMISICISLFFLATVCAWKCCVFLCLVSKPIKTTRTTTTQDQRVYKWEILFNTEGAFFYLFIF